MRKATLLLATLLAIGCGDGFSFEAHEGQSDAVNFVAHQMVADGWGDPRPVVIGWHEGAECIGGIPSTLARILGIDTDPRPIEERGCRTGRSWPTGLFCIVELVERGDEGRYSQTSLVHELGHCTIWDWKHQVMNMWEQEVPRLNFLLALREMGLQPVPPTEPTPLVEICSSDDGCQMLSGAQETP